MVDEGEAFPKAIGSLLAIALGACAATDPVPAPDRVATTDRAQWTQRCGEWDEWNKAGPPFRIQGNSWYVGTCGITAILITGDQGHILIDGGPADAGGLVAKNIEALGFKLTDVKLLLHSHEHHDHGGGLAELQRLTGARLLASPLATRAFESGRPAGDDPQAAYGAELPPVHVAGQIVEQRSVRLGSIALIPYFTPGHSPGAITWRWRSCEGRDCKWIVYADSLTPVSHEDYRFSDHPGYLEAYRQSLLKVAALRCDILLAPHPSAANMRLRLIGKAPMTDPTGCRNYARGIDIRLTERLAKEAAGTP